MARPDGQPLLTLTYQDPEESARGFLVIDSLVNDLCAGGLRVHPAVDVAQLTELARNMTLKQAVAGIRVGGAKAGLAIDPSSPARSAVLRRFMRFLRPFILDCFSCGPDMNITMVEVEAAAREVGIPAIKIAVGRRRGLTDEEFLSRYRLFEEKVDGSTVNQLRAATGVVASALVLVDMIKGKRDGARIAIQGAGNIGGAAARLLAAAGAKVVAWADDQKCLSDEAGLDVPALTKGLQAGRLPQAAGRVSDRSDVLRAPCDVLVLGAVSRAFGVDDIATLGCRGIVIGANLGLEAPVEDALHQKGTLVVPDMVASVGGSLAVEALYTGTPRSGRDVLDHVTMRTSGLVREILAASKATGLPPRAAALAKVSGVSKDAPRSIA